MPDRPYIEAIAITAPLPACSSCGAAQRTARKSGRRFWSTMRLYLCCERPLRAANCEILFATWVDDENSLRQAGLAIAFDKPVSRGQVAIGLSFDPMANPEMGISRQIEFALFTRFL